MMGGVPAPPLRQGSCEACALLGPLSGPCLLCHRVLARGVLISSPKGLSRGWRPITGGWLNKSCPPRHHHAVKKKAAAPDALLWNKLRDILPREESKVQNTACGMFCHLFKKKIYIRTRSSMQSVCGAHLEGGGPAAVRPVSPFELFLN